MLHPNYYSSINIIYNKLGYREDGLIHLNLEVGERTKNLGEIPKLKMPKKLWQIGTPTQTYVPSDRSAIIHFTLQAKNLRRQNNLRIVTIYYLIYIYACNHITSTFVGNSTPVAKPLEEATSFTANIGFEPYFCLASEKLGARTVCIH